MKINLHKVSLQAEIGKVMQRDINKEFADAIHMETSDIGVMYLMRKISHAQGEVEIPDNLIPYIAEMTEKSRYLKAFVKEAVLKILGIDPKQRDIWT